jgi:putative inorganic carbon (HCO3(-)) transporter
MDSNGRPAAASIPFPASFAWLLVAASLLAALLAGTAMAVNPLVGGSLVVALWFVPLVLLNLPLGIALWVPSAFLIELQLPLPAVAMAGILIVLAWLGTLRAREIAARPSIGVNRRLFTLLGVLLAWVTLTAAWAKDLGPFGPQILRWGIAALLFVILTTTIKSGRDARLLAGAFVVGAVLSIVFGLFYGTPSDPSVPVQTGRLYGGSGDPNYSAAGYLAGIIMAAGLLGGARRPERRLLLVAAMVVLAAGLAATQSRGGLLGAVAAAVAALALYRGRRGQVIAVVVTALSVAALIFAFSPAGWERVVRFQGEDPRREQWLVAGRIALDHPVAGVGLNNFGVEARKYVGEPGALQHVELIAEKQVVVHNVVLQLLADTGLIGATLYVWFILACLRATLLAAKRFDAQDREDLAGLARATAVAIIAMISASMFLSNVTDERTWLLLALGPTLLSVATNPRAIRS